MLKLFFVLVGGALGTGCRYGVALLFAARSEGPSFPYATLFVNLTGSFLIGVLAELFDARGWGTPTLRAALITGLLGGYTTFSSLSLETLTLLREGAGGRAACYALGSVALGLLAVWLGARVAQSW